MESNQNTYKYKLDFYYLQALAYLVVLILYAAVRGTYVEGKFEFVFRDPIVFVMVIFVVFAFVVLVLNMARDRKLIVAPDKLIFHHKFHERAIPISEIEWMHIGRERMVQTAGRFQVIVFKIKGRRRLFRIRVGRYEREKELVAEMRRIADRVPKMKRPMFRIQSPAE
jgi:hypothetical protein